MKSIRLLMILSMFVFVFSGCASKEAVEETTEPETMEATDMSQPADTMTQAVDTSAVVQ